MGVINLVEGLQVVLIVWLQLFFQAHVEAHMAVHLEMVHLRVVHRVEAHLGVVHLGVALQEDQIGVKDKYLQTHINQWILLINVNLLDNKESWESRMMALVHSN